MNIIDHIILIKPIGSEELIHDPILESKYNKWILKSLFKSRLINLKLKIKYIKYEKNKIYKV
jgi:hypothetical protein